MATIIQHEVYPRLQNPKGGVILEGVWKWKVANANYIINLSIDYVVSALNRSKINCCVTMCWAWRIK